MEKRRLLKILLAICALCWSVFTYAQTSTAVTGEVYDSGSAPLAGVSVVEKGKSTVAVTDRNGKFSLNVSNPNATLSFSCLGKESAEEKLEGRIRVKITLNDSQNTLDDIVVIGYGTARKGDLTGSVAVVGREAFDNKLVTSMEDALRGKVAGTRILSDNGEPGEDLNIRIRGSGSLNASNAPIYVIDGIVSETADIASDDIESVNILKDASATAIYGSKGSNGVVIITTKQGKGHTSVSFNAKFSVAQPVRLLNLMETPQYAQTMMWNSFNYYPKDATGVNWNQASRNYYLDSEGNYYVYNTMNKWTNSQYTDPSDSNYIDTDWQRLMMRSVFVQDYSINVNGSDDKGKFSVMGGYMNQPGILVRSSYERYSLRANYERKLGPKGGLFGMNFSGFNTDKQGLSTDGSGSTMNMLVQAPSKPPWAAETDAEGSENILENNNPYWQALHIKRHTEKTNTNLRLYFNLPIATDLKLNIAGSFFNNYTHDEQFFPSNVNQGRAQYGKATNTMTRTFNWNSENLLYWTPSHLFCNANHHFDAMGGVILEQTTPKTLDTESHNFEQDDLNSAAMQDGITPWSIVSTYAPPVRMLSYLARANYNYKGKYYLTGSIRFDGSSKFGGDNKWGVFPSGAFSWHISDEPLFKKIRQLDDLRLRVSVGATGNQSIPPLQSRSAMTELLYPTNGKAANYGIITARPGNEYLKWESLLQYDAAIEFGLFKNRLTGTLEAYYKKTTDLLFDQPVPYSSGYATQYGNIASLANRGIEITLSGTPVRKKNISLLLDYNMAFNRSKVLSLGGASEQVLNPPNTATRCTNFGILRVGQPLGNWYGYQDAGVWRSQIEIDALPDNYSSAGVDKASLRPGSTRLKDQQLPGEDGYGTVDDKDRVIIGNSQPLFTGGLSGSLRLYDFTLTVGLEFSYGGVMFNATARELTQLNSNSGRNSLASAGNYWTPTLYDKTTGLIVNEGNESSNTKMPISGWENFLSDKYLEDASYLRVDNISLAYSLPSRVRNVIMASKLSLFVSVRNAFLFTHYTGYDPDVSVGKGIYADLLPKLDVGSYPRSRTFTMGINMTF